MASKNVEAVRASYESWNRRDYEDVVRNMADNFTYIDHGSGQTIRTKQQFKDWVELWAKAFSDGRIVNPKFIDAGDTVIAEFKAEGTNDGAYAGMPATGRRMSIDFCEISHFDKNGRVISGGVYYDQYQTLLQLARPTSPCRRIDSEQNGLNPTLAPL